MSDAPSDGWLADDPLPADPLSILKRWLDEAFEAGQQPNPNAIALATAASDGSPAVRMVLCKRVDLDAGAIVFYTDRTSRKGRELAARNRAAAVFYWPHPGAGRQARVEGTVVPTSDADSDAYFTSRPVDAQVAAWASDQSQPVASREELVRRLDAVSTRFGVDGQGAPETALPRPERWGGYALRAESVELWVGRPARLHDRAVWHRTPAGWEAQRLQP